MSVLDRVTTAVKNLLLLRDEIARTTAGVHELKQDVFNHEKRLIKIETLIDLTRGTFVAHSLPPK